MTLSGLQDDMWHAEHDATLERFIVTASARLLIVYISRTPGPVGEDGEEGDPILSLRLDLSVPAASPAELTYFIKSREIPQQKSIENGSGENGAVGGEAGYGNVITAAFSTKLLAHLQYGTVKAAHIESLLRMMNNIYAPIFFENTSWPDSILFTH